MNRVERALPEPPLKKSRNAILTHQHQQRIWRSIYGKEAKRSLKGCECIIQERSVSVLWCDGEQVGGELSEKVLEDTSGGKESIGKGADMAPCIKIRADVQTDTVT